MANYENLVGLKDQLSRVLTALESEVGSEQAAKVVAEVSQNQGILVDTAKTPEGRLNLAADLPRYQIRDWARKEPSNFNILLVKMRVVAREEDQNA